MTVLGIWVMPVSMSPSLPVLLVAWTPALLEGLVPRPRPVCLMLAGCLWARFAAPAAGPCCRPGGRPRGGRPVPFLLSIKITGSYPQLVSPHLRRHKVQPGRNPLGWVGWGLAGGWVRRLHQSTAMHTAASPLTTRAAPPGGVATVTPRKAAVTGSYVHARSRISQQHLRLFYTTPCLAAH